MANRIVVDVAQKETKPKARVKSKTTTTKTATIPTSLMMTTKRCSPIYTTSQSS